MQAFPDVMLLVDVKRVESDITPIQHWITLWKACDDVQIEEVEILNICADSLATSSEYEATAKMLRGKVRELLIGKEREIKLERPLESRCC